MLIHCLPITDVQEMLGCIHETLENVADVVQLTALDKSTFTDMERDQQTLSAIGIHHGDMVSSDPLTGRSWTAERPPTCTG